MTQLRVTTGGGALAASERLAAEIGPVIYRSVLQGAFVLGRKIATAVEAFKETPGTKRLSRSFLVPVPGAGGFILGYNSPVYAAIHEFGGKIKAKRKEWLVFQLPNGEWRKTKEVTIREKRYARSAMEEFEREGTMATMLAANLTATFKGA
jgi:phage gpG-like protein